MTRNPLYFGVLQCEVGAAMFVVHQAPILLPGPQYLIGVLTIALLYAVSFNWNMAKREAGYMHRHFGEEYQRYRNRVPFVFPLITPLIRLLRLRKEIQ